MDTDEWIAHMSSLGFVRLEDERKKWTRPWTAEDLIKELEPADSLSDEKNTDLST
jgi:hypothetical protein